MVTVSIANVPDDHVIALEAVHGSLDESIVLVAPRASWSPPPPPPPPPSSSASASASSSSSSASPAAPSPPLPGAGTAKERIAIVVSEAKQAGASARLQLVDPLTRAAVMAVDIGPGQRVYLRLVGDGFASEGIYRADLTIFGAEPAVYRVRVKSTAPSPPLGMRATKWADTFADLRPGERKAVSTIIPVDDAGEGDAPYRVLVLPAAAGAASAGEGAQPLPACGVIARPVGRGAIRVELPQLGAGRYVGALSIQGQTLDVDVTLKSSFWWVWLLVAAGAALSLGVREYLRYSAAREALERQIAAKEREIEKKKAGLLAWDEICSRNVLRTARGMKTYLALDDANEIMPDAQPRERPERLAIEQALEATGLPAPVRAALRARFERLGRLSSRADAADVDRGLAELAKSARAGFSTELLEWLGEQERVFEDTRARVVPLLETGDLARDERGRAQVKAALRVLHALIQDAITLSLDVGLGARQAAILGKVEPALRLLCNSIEAGRVPSQILELVHCELGALEAGAEAKASVAPPPKGLRLRVRGPGPTWSAQEELTFELVYPDGDLETAPVWESPGPVTWLVDRREVFGRGSGRFSYVFEDARLWGLRERRVQARAQGVVLAEARVRIRRPEVSPAVVERFWSAGARLAATVVGVIIVGASAVGVLWSGKPFGSAADYVGALLTGLGADLTVVAGGGKLLTTVIDALTKPREERS